MVTPQTLREWKISQGELIVRHQITHSYPHSPYVSVQSTLSSSNREIIDGGVSGITFKADWDDDLEVSVLIKEPLSSTST